MLNSKGQFINGSWHKSSGSEFKSTNPADGSYIWHGANANANDVSTAYDSAVRASGSWASMSFEKRVLYTKHFAEIIEKNKEYLAKLISLETGKPLWESTNEVQSVLAKVGISILAYQERTWAKHTVSDDNTKACVRYKPQGVVVVLGAFNFPAHISNGHIIPALLAGNTIIYKPSEYTPAVAEFIINCWQEASLPEGVLNCLQGGPEVATALFTKDIQGVYFTGSYRTGLSINQIFSSRPEVILALEMGGNNPLVLDEVADTKAAVYNAIQSTMITTGQRCTCARRLMIPNTAQGDNFLKDFIKACSLIRIGTYDEQPQPFMGPVISHQQALNHLNAQQNLEQLGGESLLSMSLSSDATAFLSPGIMDMTKVIEPPDEEIFAPFVQIYRYHDFDHAIELANQTRYGLAAGLISDSEQNFQKFYASIRSGLINWNKPTTGASSSLPFGGVGHSGNHRPSAFFASDYCSYPVASMEQTHIVLPEKRVPGIILD